MNLNQLHYFAKLAEVEHYTKAAEELGVTVDETLLEGAAETFDSISK